MLISKIIAIPATRSASHASRRETTQRRRVREPDGKTGFGLVDRAIHRIGYYGTGQGRWQNQKRRL